MASIGILGAGSWGTALAVLLGNKGHQVALWSHREEAARRLARDRENEKLPGVKIPEPVDITWDLEKALKNRDVLVLAVPSSQMRSTCRRIASGTETGQILVSVSKGIEDGTFATMTDMIREAVSYTHLHPERRSLFMTR